MWALVDGPQMAAEEHAATPDSSSSPGRVRGGSDAEPMAMQESPPTHAQLSSDGSAAPLPSLPADCVAAVLSHASLPTIGCAARVCRDWLATSRAEAVALAVLRRRWQFRPEHLPLLQPDGDELPPPVVLSHPFSSWWQLLRALARLDDYFVDLRRLFGACESIHHRRIGSIVGAPFAAALDRLDREVQEFCVGLMAGFMPNEDGVFTYHGPSATPIHYRHVQTSAEPFVEATPGGSARVTPNNGITTLDHGTVLVGRQGGRWEWSTDRLVWSSTATVAIPDESAFGGLNWALAPQNEQLVRFLEDYPVLPLFRAQVALAGGGTGEGRFPRSVDDAFWVSAHGGVVSHNSSQCDTFKQRIITHAPTMPCVTARSLTVHQLLQPPIVIRIDRPADIEIPRLPVELRQAMQAVRPYVVRRGNHHGIPTHAVVVAASETVEIWRTWNVIRLADRKVRASVLAGGTGSLDAVAGADLSIPEDADGGGWVVTIAPNQG